MSNSKLLSNAKQILENERANFTKTHPTSLILSKKSSQHFLYGVPLHWMKDWSTPSPLFVKDAQGSHFTCADDLDYVDFCLGDSGAMFGHSPEALSKALITQSSNGFTTMLPSVLASDVGEALFDYFGLPYWQLATTATDANRFVIRWARAITGREKILVFDGCYHGTVDDTMVDVVDGKTTNRASLLGQVHNIGAFTEAVTFNNILAVEEALAQGNFACIITEPALTNCGMVLPTLGFIESLRNLSKKYGCLLVLDETHTLSAGCGGWAKNANIVPDFLVIGKPIAGGFPAAAYGFSNEIANRMMAAKDHAPAGHSGIGTTLSGNMMTLAAINCTLRLIATEAAYQQMLNMATFLNHGLEKSIYSHGLPWSVTRLGARLELQFCINPPNTAQEARMAQNETLESAMHLFLLNRGVLLTPFHNMMLVCPDTNLVDINYLLKIFADFLDLLTRQ